MLRDFHPFSTKLLSWRGKKPKLDGNYFDCQLAPADVAYSKYASGGSSTASAGDSSAGGSSAISSSSNTGGGSSIFSSAGRSRSGNGASSGIVARPQQPPPRQVYLRRWTLGEIVSAFGWEAGFAVECLDEETGSRLDEKGVPKIFTLVARKL